MPPWSNLAAEGLTDGVHLVGDVMRDLAARTLTEVRKPSALAGVAGGGLRTGEFLFATVHRAENRPPDAIRGWVGLLDGVARADRPVVLALHPGTRAAIDALGVEPSPNVIVVEPLGYRSSLAAQLHAAAVLTDSGGVQREAAWLGTPCLVLAQLDRVARDDRGRRGHVRPRGHRRGAGARSARSIGAAGPGTGRRRASSAAADDRDGRRDGRRSRGCIA